LKKTDGENPLDVAAKPAFQTLAVNIPGIVYRVHVRERNRMEFFNPMLEQMTGYKAEELTLGEVCSIDPMIIPEDHLHVLEVVKGALRENKPFEIEYRITDKNGGIRYFLERGQPICGTDGKPEFIDGVILDITERKCSEIALLFKENIINSSSSVIATCDLEGSMTYGNPSFLKKWGFNDPKEFVGRPFWEFWLVKNRLDEIMQALRDDGHWFGEIKARRKDGGIFDVQVSAATVSDTAGYPVALTSTSIDITERKRAEKALQEAHDELEWRVKERTAELELKNKELQDFAFVASHDLAEPLRKVETFGKMLADRCVGGTFDEVSKDYLRRMKSAAERMKGLLDSLLMYSRVTTRAEPLKKTDLNKSIEEALSNLEMVIRAKNAEVEICDLPTVDADRAQMIQLFQNLIGNALKFSRKGKPPHVKIYSQEVGDAFEIHVKDNGIGFEEKYLEKIFLPFQRLHGRSSEYGGEGMGLAICKKIIERHGAEITARSSTGSGSTFIIRLPSKRCPWTATPCSEHCDSQQEEKP
jgi:PAS domain S-box-containing protein